MKESQTTHFLYGGKMKDQNNIKQYLINDLIELRQRMTELEPLEDEHRRAEETLGDSEDGYRSLFDHIPVGLYRTTPRGEILDANPALVQMLGYSDRKSLLATNAAHTYLNSESRIQWQTLMERDGVVRNFEKQLRRTDGSMVWVEENSRVVRDVAGRVLCYEGSFQDITERKRAEEELARQNGKLEILNETKDRFLGIAAHDLRNPLTVVSVSTKLLQKRITEQTSLTLLNNISRSTEKMLALINSLLDVSKIKSGKLEMRTEDVDVAELLKECYDENEIIGRQKGIALALSVPEDIGNACLDKERMVQAVDNLLSNAFKYSNPNTTVTLGAKRTECGLEIRVEDQGVGIKNEDLPLLFGEFSKASAQPTAGEPSHGLGLAIVKRVVELQGGRIDAMSNPGGGATFTITLP